MLSLKSSKNFKALKTWTVKKIKAEKQKLKDKSFRTKINK